MTGRRRRTTVRQGRGCYWHDCLSAAVQTIEFRAPHILRGRRDYCEPHTTQVAKQPGATVRRLRAAS